MSTRLLHVGSVAAAVMLAWTGSVRAQDPASIVEPPRAGLHPIAMPRLEPLEPAVADHLREAQRMFETTSARASARELSDAYGTLGRVLHAYEFFDAAEACYLNATGLRRAEVRWLHLRAYLYQQTGRFDDAAALYLSARRASPDDYPATVHLGEVYLGLGRSADAREQFEAVVERYPGAAHAGLGEVSLRERRFNEAIDHFHAALDRLPDATSIHYSLAMAYRGLGRLDEARSQLERRGAGGARVADPIVDELQTIVRGERAYVMQGRHVYEAGQFRSAADLFRKAVDAAPASATPRVNLGLALAQLGDVNAAIEQFDAGLRLDPDNLTAHTGLGLLLARQKRDREAVEHLNAAFRQSPADTQISGALVAALVRLARTDEAIEVLSDVRRLDPDEEGTLLRLSLLLSDRERYREAVDRLDESHRRFPDRTLTATTLARLLASSPDRAVRDGQRALDLAKTVYEREPIPVHGETIALALAELDRCEEAAGWMQRAIDEAVRIKDTVESVRLKAEAVRYARRPCRP